MSGPLRYLYAVPAPLGSGGLGNEALRFVRAAAAEGWDVRALACRPSRPVEGVKVCEFDVTRMVRLARWTPARFSPAWLRLIQERAFDRRARGHVGRPQFAQAMASGALHVLRRARRAGAVTVAESATAHPRHVRRVTREEEAKRGSIAHFHNRWTVARAEREFAEADFVLGCSAYTARTLVEEGVPAEKVAHVPLSVEMPERFARHEPGLPFRCLFVGQLHLLKGFPYLLEAWERLRLPRAELLLRGGTGDRFTRRLVARWRAHLDFTVEATYGLVPYEDFSVLVLPSLTDGFGLVVLEAMAAGLPVVVTERVGAAECVRDGRDGFVVPPADAERLAEAIEVLYRDADRRAAMGRAARARAAEYSFEAFRMRYASQVRAWMAAKGRGEG